VEIHPRVTGHHGQHIPTLLLADLHHDDEALGGQRDIVPAQGADQVGAPLR
jgi:hypothetical protein